MTPPEKQGPSSVVVGGVGTEEKVLGAGEEEDHWHHPGHKSPGVLRG